jgi:hypothetical protein
MLPMLMPPARRTAPSILEELKARVDTLESLMARLLYEVVERQKQRTAPPTKRAVPRQQRREMNMATVGTWRLKHPDWPMRVIADKCDLKLDYCNQLWREYRTANGIGAVRERRA